MARPMGHPRAPGLGVVCAGAALFALAPALQARQGVVQNPLRPGADPRDESLLAGSTHRWTVPTSSGVACSVRVDPLDTDVALLFDPSGGDGRHVDAGAGRRGVESVFWVAADASPAAVEVRPVHRRAGRYRIAAACRPATETDHERAAAEAELRELAAGVGAGEATLPRLEAVRSRLASLGLAELEAYALNLTADAARMRGDLSGAQEASEACVALARERSLERRQARCLRSLAIPFLMQGQMTAGMERLDQALAVWERLDEPAEAARVIVTRAIGILREGDYERAESELRRAVALLHEEGAHEELGLALGNLSLVHHDRGDYGEAIASLERARELFRRTGSRSEAMAVANLATLYSILGDTRRGLALGRQVVASDAPVHARARAQASVAADLEDLGDLDGAIREYRSAVTLARDAGDTALEREAEASLGWALARRGDFDGAERYLRAAVAAHRDIGDLRPLAKDWILLGRTRLLAGRHDDAAEAFEQALEIASTAGMVDRQADAWTGLARVSFEAGELHRSLARVDDALTAVESVRARVMFDESRAGYLGRRRGVFDLAVEVRLALEDREPGRGHLERALETAEQAKARSLLDEVAGARARIRRKVDPALAARWRRAAERISRVQRAMLGQAGGGGASGAGEALESELREASAEEQEARRAIHRTAPDYARLLDPHVAATRDLQELLADDEVLVEYHVGETASWVFVLDADGPAAWEIEGEAELRDGVERLREQLGAPRLLGAAAYARQAHELYGRLLGPAAARLEGKRRLVIVPDGPLWKLPFEALVTAEGGRRFADLDYLLRRWSVVYGPSGSVLASLRDAGDAREAAGDPDLVAFANPSFPAGSVRPSAEPGLQRAVFGDAGMQGLGPLPHAEREARAVARLFGEERSLVYLGDAAREAAVKGDPAVSRARYLLFSTHALLSEVLPAQSGLLLAAGADAEEDGLLQVYEIYNLELPARLAVLSACDTGLGRHIRGEGLVGLARAFFYAGTGAIVASLWRVSDDSTADLTIELFRGLLQPGREGDAADALRAAKLALLEQRRWAHPYHWAPFVLLGAPDAPGPASARHRPSDAEGIEVVGVRTLDQALELALGRTDGSSSVPLAEMPEG